MLNQSSISGQRSYENLLSLVDSPNVGSCFKKKQFSRKPAFQPAALNPDHRKKTLEDVGISPQVVFNTTSPVNKPEKNESKTSKPLVIGTTARQRIISTRISEKDTIFYSPKAQNLNYWKDLSYISQNTCKKQENRKEHLKKNNKDITDTSGPNLNLSQIVNQRDNKKDSGSQRFFKQGHLKNRTSSTTFLPEKDSTAQLKNKENQSQLSFVNSCGSKSSKTFTIQCFYCKNNKKMADLINQKYQKLEKQFTSRLQENLQLQVLCNNLKIQNIQVKKAKDQLVKQLSQLKTQHQKLKEDFVLKVENQREEIMKLKQKMKYSQIERSILLRMKEDHQALAKFNLQLKNQHQVMKKTIIANNQVKISKNCFQKKKNPTTPNLVKASKPFAFNSPQCRPYQDNEDDNISLNLSEFSFDNILE